MSQISDRRCCTLWTWLVLAAMAMGLGAPTPAAAQSPIERQPGQSAAGQPEDGPDGSIAVEALLSDQYGGISLGSDAQGDRAALGVGLRAHILGVEADEIVFLGQTPILDRVVRAVALEDDLLFVGLSDMGGIYIYDIADPGLPVEIARFPTAGEVRNFDVGPDRVYVAVLGGLRVLDRPGPGQFVERELELPHRSVSAVRTVGERLFLLDSTSGLHVFDIDGETLRPRGVLPLEDTLLDATKQILQLDAQRLVVVQGFVHIVDVSDPDSPTTLETIVTGGHAVNAALSSDGGRLAVGNLDGGLAIYDSSAEAGYERLGAATSVQGVVTVAWTPRGLLWTDWLDGMRLAPDAAAGNLAAVARYLPTSFADGIAVGEGGRVFSTSASSGLDVLERELTTEGGAPLAGARLRPIAHAALPEQVRSTRVRWTPGRIGVLGPHGGVWLLPENAEAGESVSREPLTLAVYDGEFSADGQRMILAGGFDGLHEIAIETDRLRRAATLPTESMFNGLALVGGLAAVASRGDGLLLADVSEAGRPRWLGSAPSADEAIDVALKGDFAFLVNRSGLLEAFDVSDPNTPRLAATVPLGGGVLRLEASPTAALLYVLVNEHTLVPVDVSAPDAPEVGRAYAFPERLNDLIVDDARVWVTAGRLGVLGAELPFVTRSAPPAMPTDPPTPEPTAPASETAAGTADAGSGGESVTIGGMGRGAFMALAGGFTALLVVAVLLLWSRRRTVTVAPGEPDDRTA